VDKLTLKLQFGHYNAVVEADIKGCFDTSNHDWMLRMLQERIDDGAFLRLIKKWLKAGVLDTHGTVLHPASGTPQGGSVSPVLAKCVFALYARLVVSQGGQTALPGRGVPDSVCRRLCATTARRSVYDVSTLKQPCCTQDEGRPLAAALQEEAANHLTLRGSRARVVSGEETA